MKTTLDFNGIDPRSWLEAIPSYQSSTVIELLKSKSYEEAADVWLSSNGPESNAVLGTIPVGGSFFQNVRTELSKLICGDPDYERVRADAAKIWNGGKTSIVSIFSAFVATKIGVAAVVVAPAVALLLAAASKVGTTAWCASRKL
jgi:hypothetical protein